MPRSSPPLLKRLRRHHGLWRLCIVVLLFKLVTGAVCLADTPSSAQVLAIDSAVALVQPQVDTAHDDGAEACLLGEAGGCHCACAHAAPLVAHSTSTDFRAPIDFIRAAFPSGYRPLASGSLLRPPIS